MSCPPSHGKISFRLEEHEPVWRAADEKKQKACIVAAREDASPRTQTDLSNQKKCTRAKSKGTTARGTQSYVQSSKKTKARTKRSKLRNFCSQGLRVSGALTFKFSIPRRGIALLEVLIERRGKGIPAAAGDGWAGRRQRRLRRVGRVVGIEERLGAFASRLGLAGSKLAARGHGRAGTRLGAGGVVPRQVRVVSEFPSRC